MYAKVFKSMYEGTLATKGPWEALVTFQQFLVLSDKFGVVDMTPEYIAKVTTIPLPIIRLGIAALEQPDPESRIGDDAGRRITRLRDNTEWGWRVTNHAHYRAIRNAEERAEYQKEQYKKRKNSKACDVDSTGFNNSTISTISTPHTHTQKHTHTQNSSLEELKEKGVTHPKRKACGWPKDFTLKASLYDYAWKQGIEKPRDEFENFQNYCDAHGKTYVDWEKAWMQWCRSPYQQQPKQGKGDVYSGKLRL